MDFKLIAVVTVVAVLLHRVLQVGKRDPRMPPGPPTLPLLGNLHQIPKTNLTTKIAEWTKKYGSVFSLKFGSSNVVILCDRKAIFELFQKRGQIYSDRPQTFMGNYLHVSNHIFALSAGPEWRMKRKLVAHNFSPKQLDEKHFRVQEAEATILMNGLLENPDDVFDEVRRFAASVASTIVWGYRAVNYDSYWAKALYDMMDERSRILEPGATPPIDQFPFLKYLPIGRWKKDGDKVRDLMYKTWGGARDMVNKRRQAGDKRDCIADEVMNEYEHKGWPMTDESLTFLMGELVEGGADTTTSQVLTLVLAFAKNPEVQRKAQAEIDAVCETARSPLWSDFNDLPYINAIVKEGMRWRPEKTVTKPLPLLDDTYEGMLIPRGTILFIGITALHNDEKYFPNPDKFDPDRYLKFDKLANDYAGSAAWEERDKFSSAHASKPKLTYMHITTVHFAERSMWRIAAKLLWAFDICEYTDPVTNQVKPLDTHAYSQGILHSPLPFKVHFKPRGPEYVSKIKSELGDALSFLECYN
ncbi:putative cytochrome P450 oxidoreductase [Ilyonectria sp. MPI-CAGE-AT-0026]|nr:putative cytochrome P450 oxidoreductase [Ilyonectria sp. MPI-CAGE-AT-0026]